MCGTHSQSLPPADLTVRISKMRVIIPPKPKAVGAEKPIRACVLGSLMSPQNRDLSGQPALGPRTLVTTTSIQQVRLHAGHGLHGREVNCPVTQRVGGRATDRPQCY